MQKILLTGISGFLGTYLYEALKVSYEIIGTYNTPNPYLPPNAVSLNLLNLEAIKSLVLNIKSDYIIHTAAISSIAQCEQDEVYSSAINIGATQLLAEVSKQCGATFIFCSTDLVFDGKKGNYTESDLPNPINIYGKQKAQAEKDCIAINENSIIARLPLMIGENKIGASGVIAEMKTKDALQQSMQLFTNEYRSPARVQDVVEGIRLLMQHKVSGIYHLGGDEKLNRYTIAERIKLKYKLQDLELIATTHQAQNCINRPEDVSMENAKMKALGYQPQSIP